MSENTTVAAGRNWIGRFLDFETLIGSGLIKFVYYAGLIGIALFVLFGMFGSLAGGFGDGYGNGGMGILGFILFPLFGVLMVILWRFYCELAILAFQIYNRMGEIRDRLPPG
ncbi:MAG TPA: DUF4282 domain-containing protein [Caulobacter sp.]|nr:DUF4282 domain-containing protein [Caulobacter sp.]